MSIDELKQVVLYTADKYHVDANLIKAIITIESNWQPYAFRYEVNYQYLVNVVECASKSGISTNSETILQKSSFGLMQLMGANFRSLGYLDLLTKCFDPQINIDYGCKHFKETCDKYPIITDKIAAYNAGSPKKNAAGLYLNQDYVTKVLCVYDLE